MLKTDIGDLNLVERIADELAKISNYETAEILYLRILEASK